MTFEIRLLSLHQPWASLIALGLKQYETRPWQTPYRGRIAIQASKKTCCLTDLRSWGFLPKLYTEPSPVQQQLEQVLEPFIKNGFPYGALVAVVEQTDCLVMAEYLDPMPEDKPHLVCEDQSPLERAVGDWRSGRYAHKYENIRPIAQPIPCKGHQGLRRIQDAGVLEAIEQQLTYTAQIEQQLTAVNEGGAA